MNLDDDHYVGDLPAGPRRTIPEADRELLELAARAMGAVRVEYIDGEEWVNLHFADGSVRHGWNSLQHSDDSLDLAVQLDLDVIQRRDQKGVFAVRIDDDGDARAWAKWSECGGDKLATTRLAITRGAAELA